MQRRLAAGKGFITCQECDERVDLIDFIEQRLKSDPVAQKIFRMEETATRRLDAQALEQILIGHVQAIAGEANQIFRELTKFDYGIDGEVEFKDNDGRASGKKIYVQLKSGNSYLRTRKDGERSLRPERLSPPDLLGQPAGRCVPGDPPDGRTEERANDPVDEHHPLPEEPPRSAKPPDCLRRGGPHDGGCVEVARYLLPSSTVPISQLRAGLGCGCYP